MNGRVEEGVVKEKSEEREGQEETKRTASGKDKKVMGLLILGLVGVLAVVIGKSWWGERAKWPESQFEHRVVILGFDGLSPEIVEPMMGAGKLENFRKLSQEGSYRRLATTNPPQSPVAWSGFATGKNPGKHGVYDFITREVSDYSLSLSLSKFDEKNRPQEVKKAKSFWDYTSDAGVESIIIDCPVTFPPDKIKGRMLSGMGVPDILGTEGTFTFYTTRAGGVNDDVGGQVLRLEKSNKTESYLVGPKVAKGKGAENVKVPMEIEINDDKKSIKLVYQGKEVELGEKQWSDWQEVTFKLDWLKKVRGVFKFYPVEVEPDLRLYVSPINYDPRDPVYPISYPKKYSQELAEAIGWYHTQGLPIDTWAVNENRLDEEALLEQAEEVFAERKSMLDYELEKSDKGILYVYFGSPDTVQHMFWRFRDEDHPLYDKDAPEEYRTKIEQWYEKLDGVLGEVMEKVGDEDLLIVLSDHGFNTFRRSVNLNTWLRKNGYLQLKDPQAAVGGELLAEIDWSKTKAYAVGFGGIYLNLEGREGQGVVKPGEEAEVLKNELAKKLEDWLDEKTGKSVVSRVYDGKEIFWGEEAKGMPDLYVGFNVGYRASWQTALGGVPEELIEDNMLEWSGTHLVDPELVPGVLLVNKPGVKEKPSILDVAPTILKYVGFEGDKLAGEDFDGTPLL